MKQKILMLVACLMSSVLSLHADLIQESSTFGSPEHIYTMTNGGSIKVGTMTAPTQSGANVGFFAFYVDDKSMNTYYIYNCSNQKWLTYTASQSYSNGINFVEFTDNVDDAKSFVVHNYADENYQIRPLTSVGRAELYLNWFNGLHSNPYDGETTLGLWQQDGATDPGSCWTFQEISTGVLVNGLYYKLDVATRTAELAKRPSDVTYSGDIVIPASISVNDLDFTVTSISALSFRLCGELTSITIPSTVTSIAPGAFTGCVGLTSIIVHEDNPAYDSRGNCNALIETASNTLMHGCDNTIIPNTVENIYFGAFQGCKGFTHIDIPNSVTNIGRQAFFECNLTSIFIPKSVTSIGEYAFNYGNFTSIVVEEGNPVYDSRENCNALIETASNTLLGVCQSTTIPNTIEIISANVFSGIDGLTHIDIPNSVSTIESRAFYGCDGLTHVAIPNSVTSIGIGAFGNCTGLQSVTFQSVTPPTAAAFINSDSSTIVYVPIGAASNYIGEPWSNYDVQEINSRVLVDGLYYNVDPATKTAEVAKYEEGAPYSGNIVIPANISAYGLDFAVTAIGDWAFDSCVDLTDVVIPSSVTKIGYATFFGCTGLTNIALPNSVTTIKGSAFGGCSSLGNVDMPDSLASIGAEAFFGCTSMTSVELPNTLTSLGASAFNGCSALNHLVLSNSIETIAYRTFNECSALESVMIPASVKVIGESAFMNCLSLIDVAIPYSVTEIKRSAFWGCKALQTLVIPGSVTLIEEHVVAYCPALTNLSVVAGNEKYDSRHASNAIIETATNTLIAGCKSTDIPNTVTKIGDSSFYGCSTLLNITIPYSVTTIGGYAFSGCTNLQAITIPASVTNIGSMALDDCINLNQIVVDAGNPVYDSRNNCNALIETATNKLLRGCKNTIIPNTVTSITSYAFCECEGLVNITIPSSVTTIGEWAFGECPSMEYITLLSSTPPTADEDTFGWLTRTELKAVYVPRGATANYNVAPWNAYTIVETPTPENEKYYVLKSCGEGDRIAYATNAGAVALQPEWSNITSGRQVWKACLTDDVVKFQNLYTEGFITTSPELYRSYTTSETGSEYVMSHLGNGSFLLSDNTYVSPYIYMHADKSYNQVVRWEDASNVQNAWEFVEVPADVVEELLAQKERNRTLEAKKYALTRHDFFGDSETFTDHGLIRNASFISTNKQEPKEGPIEHLLDGDVNTFFHSTWSTANTDDEFHYLQVDLGEAVGHLGFRFARRIGTQHNDAPKTIRLYGTNDLTSDTWNEWFTFDLEYNYSAFGYDGLIADPGIGEHDGYRYIRIVVEDTNDGRITNGNLFFSLSEFGIWDTRRWSEFRESLTADEQAEIHDAIADAKAELAAEAATQGTIDRLNAALKLISEIEVLTDGENFTNAVEKEASRISYSRNFKNTNWQPWYVPFEMEYDAISDNFDVARLNDVHQFDDNNDGEFERWALEIERLKSGDVIQANLPYMVRAKATGETKFYVDDAILYPSESNSIDCSSTRVLYTFTGIYAPISGVDLRENGCYIMSSGKLLTPTVSTTLKPYRWYLQPEARAGYATFYAPKQILVFEKDEFGTTGIEGAVMDDESAISWPADVYDLNGRLVMKQATSLDALPKGVYMIGGVKIIK